MAHKARARVTAVYEISAKAAPHLEHLLRKEVPQHIACTFLEATIHAEQVPLEAEAGERPQQQGGGLASEPRDAGDDGELARPSGPGEQEPGGGDADDGLQGDAVPRQEDGNLTDE